MKLPILLAFCSLILLSEHTIAQKQYKNEPLITAQKQNADISLGKEWGISQWRISPQIAHDTLNVSLYSDQEQVGFRTDQDSIIFKIKPGETKSFYVKLGDAEPAHTIIVAKAYKWDQVSYNKKDKRKDIQLFFDKPATSYSDSLRQLYPLNEVIKNARTDQEKVMSILNWTHHQWKHNGGNSPKGSTGIAILNEAHAGGQFPCFAYAIVLRDQLVAYGYKARVLYLKTKDAENRKGSPGHVATEVYMNDLKKWAFIDGQFNIMPTLHGKPLNAVEFQQALSKNYEDVVFASKDEVSKRGYTDFVYDYLYYFDTTLDNRLLPADKRFTVNGKRSIMLVPEGAPNLTKISFWNSTVDYCVYTHSLKDFYAQPK
ncbi:transglutaminase domain-containing protein [Pedobacter metabolipauper]|uniref:Transglutaminase-like domain-containing protein n=1 Tax=Pedobacter metabolipauper TaxID=425513 RepID=A0A4R6SX44_9SPHI|nr:transglutaminase domain-containing protein [Pedobacter metabolipauper]TDQ09204.1 hypothetical protein ATK78_1358 [Pedobacter metabolipauper]